LTGDLFPLPVNAGCVDGRVFPLAEFVSEMTYYVSSGTLNSTNSTQPTSRVDGPSTRVVETGLKSGSDSNAEDLGVDLSFLLP